MNVKRILLALLLSLTLVSIAACGNGEVSEPELEYRTTDTHLQWRYEGEDTWRNVMPLDQLRGDDGQDGQDGSQGAPGTDGQDGEDGREVQIRSTDTMIQWRYEGESIWRDLMPLSMLRGPRGQTGPSGASAYEMYLENNPNYDKTEDEWLDDLTGNRLSKSDTLDILTRDEFVSAISDGIERIQLQNDIDITDLEDIIGFEEDDVLVIENPVHINFNGYTIEGDLEIDTPSDGEVNFYAIIDSKLDGNLHVNAPNLTLTISDHVEITGDQTVDEKDTDVSLNVPEDFSDIADGVTIEVEDGEININGVLLLGELVEILGLDGEIERSYSFEAFDDDDIVYAAFAPEEENGDEEEAVGPVEFPEWKYEYVTSAMVLRVIPENPYSTHVYTINVTSGTETTTSIDYNDLGLGTSYNDEKETVTLDDIDFGYKSLLLSGSDIIQGQAYNGEIYNLDPLYLLEVKITFDDSRPLPNYNLLAGYGARETDPDEDNYGELVYARTMAPTADSTDYVHYFDFSRTSFTHFSLLNLQYAMYIESIEVTYADYDEVVVPEAEITAFLNEYLALPAETDEDLTLVEEITIVNQTYTIVWASSNEDVIATDGTITRPDLFDDNEDVTLTATITDGNGYEHTVVSEVTVLAIK